MDIVTDAGTIGCVVVRAVDTNGFTLAVRYLQNQRNQVAFGVVCLADCAAFVSTAGVEVTQGHKPHTVSICCPLEHFLHRKLCFAVRVGRAGAVAFENRDVLRFAIGSGCGGEHDFVNVIFHHGIEQNLRAAEVVVIVFQRICHAFANKRICRKVDYCVNFLLLKEIVKEIKIMEVTLIEFCTFGNRFSITCYKIICHNNIMSSLYKF